MIGLDDYQEGFMGSEDAGQLELIKAMQAGQITGRDTTNLSLTQEPLKAESLEKTLKVLEYRTKDIKLFNAMPKLTAYNTVEEYLQLTSYGTQSGGFYNEGELSNVQDSTYVRRSQLVKYMQVTGEVTMQAQMVRSYIDAMKKEVENKMLYIMRLANTAMTKADSTIIPQEFNGLYQQHTGLGVTNSGFTTFEAYYNSGLVIDLRGASLKQANIENGSLQVDLGYGTATDIFAPTTVISALSQDYYQRQRIFMDGKGFDGTIGTTPKAISTTLGDINLNADKFMKADIPRTSTSNATSPQAPTAPTVSALAVTADTKAKFTTPEAGSVYYAVSAINRYGESALTVFATPVTLAVGFGVDITLAAAAGTAVTSGFYVYRTLVTTAGSPTGLTFYPIFKADIGTVTSTGWNGAGANKIRDLGYFMANTEQAFITQMDDEVLSFKQLAPMSKLDLAVLSMSRRFIAFLFGTPILYASSKLVRIINISKSNT